MKNQLKVNMFAFTSDLGGGANGHLGFVCTPLDYANISFIPYVQPVYPGLLTILENVAQHAATRLQEDHKESLRQYRETVDVKNALTKQIVQANDPKYLNALRNRATNMINDEVQAILSYLFQRYGLVEDHCLAERELKLRGMQYNLLDLLVMVYSNIEDLK